MKQLVLCDFDGTISTQDMGYALVNRFAIGDWRSIDREYSEGKIGSIEAYSRIAGIIRWDAGALFDFIRVYSAIDPSFPHFYQYCRNEGIDVKIVSDGLDFYIKAILEAHHLSEIPFYSNVTRFLREQKIEISYPHINEECGLCGTCKRRLIQLLRKEYDSILYIGNGLSDRCAARDADFVFAKDALYIHCIDQDIPCHCFEHFGQILNDFEKEVHGVIFDLDGTLIEAYEAIYIGLKEVFLHFKREPFPYGDLKKYLKQDLEATLAQFFPSEEIPSAILIMRKKYEEVYLDHTHFMDGAREVLEALYSRGLVLGVASNKFGHFSRGALIHLGVADYFTSVIGAGDVSRNKPFPDMIHASLEAMKVAGEGAVFVGDTVTDVQTGKEAGVDVYALATGFHSKVELAEKKPRRILKDLKELLFLLEPHGQRPWFLNALPRRRDPSRGPLPPAARVKENP